MLFRAIGILLVTTHACAPDLSGQGQLAPQGATRGAIDGIVTDSSLAPLERVEVLVLSTGVAVATHENGRFRITDIPAGSYVLLVRRVGYRPVMHPVEVAAGDTLRPSFVLSRLEQALPTVTIVESGRPARLAEFERRREIGVGSFMTEEQIAKVRAIAPGDLFRRINGLTVTAPPRGFGRTVRGPGERCMDIYVDDAPFPESDIDLLPSARFIAGIEVYSNPALIPPKYANMSRRCGIILIWLK